MKTFQILRQGTSFNKGNINKIAKHFDPKFQNSLEQDNVYKYQEVDSKLPELDQQIENIKKKMLQIDRENDDDSDEEQKNILKSLKNQYKQVINQRKERLIQLQKQYKVKILGDQENIPELIDSFSKMQKKYNLSQGFMEKLKKAGFKRPTPVQMQSIPILFEKKDAIILAETGSGKSLAFITPLIHLHKKGDGLKAIIIAPTRELSIQLYKEFLMFTSIKKSNNENHSGQARIKILRKALIPRNQEQFEQFCQQVEILISTPLKLANLSEQFNFQNLEHLVIDEADKMFEMGFIEQIDTILKNCKNNLRITKFLFSATMQPGIEQVVTQVMANVPIKIQIGIKNATAQSVSQKLIYVGNEDGKLQTLRQEIKDGYEPPMLLFVQSKDRAKQLHKELRYDGVNVGTIHADMKKEERDDTIKQFRLGKIWILICTDLMSRGIDFKTVNQVINYDFPQSLVSYIHRIGRTGRGGRSGKALTFFTEDDKGFVKTIANLMKKSGDEVPEWMLNLEACDSKEWKRLEKVPIKRNLITTEPKPQIPKRFLKRMEKNMRRLEKIKGVYNPPQDIEDENEDEIIEDNNLVEENEDEWIEDDK